MLYTDTHIFPGKERRLYSMSFTRNYKICCLNALAASTRFFWTTLGIGLTSSHLNMLWAGWQRETTRAKSCALPGDGESRHSLLLKLEGSLTSRAIQAMCHNGLHWI